MKKILLLLIFLSIHQISSSCRHLSGNDWRCHLGCFHQSEIASEQKLRKECAELCIRNNFSRSIGQHIARNERCGHPETHENYYNFYCNCRK